MEKTISVEERIRKAEDRYYNTKKEKPISKKDTMPKKNKNSKLVKKLVKEIFVCLIIYIIFYSVTSNNYVFSEDFTNQTKEILDKDINVVELYSDMKNGIMNFVNEFNQEDSENNDVDSGNGENSNDNENSDDDNENLDNSENLDNNENSDNSEESNNSESKSTENIEEIQNNDENIGGAVEEETEENNEETSTLSQMEQDANFVKENISVIKPVEGTISSKYGLRNPTTATVPKNHTGTDIAAETGTKIVSASDGVVILKSSEGDYGNHLKIQIGEVVFVYAHCNTLYVNEGDEVVQGQEIAEVGATGNATGPHLHFEIRYQDRYIDPEMVLEL